VTGPFPADPAGDQSAGLCDIEAKRWSWRSEPDSGDKPVVVAKT
jgi:hypothetical protein